MVQAHAETKELHTLIYTTHTHTLSTMTSLLPAAPVLCLEQSNSLFKNIYIYFEVEIHGDRELPCPGSFPSAYQLGEAGSQHRRPNLLVWVTGTQTLGLPPLLSRVCSSRKLESEARSGAQPSYVGYKGVCPEPTCLPALLSR